MQQYQFLGEPLPGYPNEYKVVRLLNKAETHRMVMVDMPTALRRCLTANLGVIRAAADVRMAA